MSRRRALMAAKADKTQIQTFTYTHPEDWTSDTLGNSSNFVNTYLNNGNGFYTAVITNNGSTGYYGKSAWLNRNIVYPGDTGGFMRNNYTGIIASNSSFYIRQGANIVVRFIPKEEVLP